MSPGDCALPFPEGQGDHPIERLLSLLWRRRWLVFGPIAFATLIAALIVVQIPSRYTATVLLLIDPRTPHIAETEQVLPSLPTDTATVRSQIELLKARALAEAVAREQALVTDPEFNDALAPSPFSVLLGSSPEDDTAQAAATVSAFQKAVSVSLLNRSLVVALSVTSTDPAKAARLAEAMVRHYLSAQIDEKESAARNATSWLTQRLEELRQSVTEAEAEVSRFRATHALGQSGERSLAAQQRGELSLRLIVAQNERHSSEVKAARLRSAARSGSLAATPEVQASETILRIGERASEARKRLADLSMRYGPRHPKIIAAQAEVEDLEKQGHRAALDIVEAVEAQARDARISEQALAKSITDLEARRATEGAASVELADLERRADAARTLYQALLVRSQETAHQQGLETPGVRIASPATIPTRASGPQRALIILAVATGAGLFGLVLAFAAEQFDRGLRTPEEAERRLAAPVVGTLPRWSEPTIALDDGLLSLWTSLPPVSEPSSRVLAITSALSGEGKTTLALALARTLATTERVVVVDCDFRRPRLSSLAQSDSPREGTFGLLDIAASQCSLEDALHPFADAGMLLPRGGGRSLVLTPGAITRLFSSALMGKIIADLRHRFDVVLLDMPPVLAAADTRLLVPLCDTVLFAVRWGKTPDHAARQALKLLSMTDCPPVSVLLTQADAKRASYGLGYGYAYGQGRGQEYDGTPPQVRRA